jgi:DNA-binding response OmpR family regulator
MRPVLVVDDDPKIVRLVRTYLEREGLAVLEAYDGQAALAAVALHEPALIVLDVMLPEVDGLSVLEALRRSSRVAVLMLSARGSVDDRIEGLQLGADDYMPKPFSPAELVIRVKRLLDRAAPGSNGVHPTPSAPVEPLRMADLVLDPETHEVSVGNTAVGLTPAEFRLLHALLSARGRVLTRDQLVDVMHGLDDAVLDRTIDVHVGRLRAKLGDDAVAPRYVTTVRGVGYRATMSAQASDQP